MTKEEQKIGRKFMRRQSLVALVVNFVVLGGVCIVAKVYEKQAEEKLVQSFREEIDQL